MSKQYDRMVRRPRSWLPLILGTAASAALQFGQWAIKGGSLLGGSSPLWWCGFLAVNLVITLISLRAKRFLARTVQRYLINPPIRLLLHLGVMPLGLALLETTGRRTGRLRRVPVGNGRQGSVFWIIAEHGWQAGYVRNIAENPRVRVKFRRGLRFRWTEGVATLLPDDDPWARQRKICRWHPLRILNAINVQVLGTAPMTVRIDLDPAARDVPGATAERVEEGLMTRRP